MQGDSGNSAAGLTVGWFRTRNRWWVVHCWRGRCLPAPFAWKVMRPPCRNCIAAN